jgi:hypothetical protein
MRKFGSLLTSIGLATILAGLAVFAFAYVTVIHAYISDVPLVSEETFGAITIAVPTIIGIGALVLFLGVVIALGIHKPRDDGL